MPTPDLDDLDPEANEAEGSDSRRASSDKPTINYKAKYEGMQREYERLKKRFDSTQAENDSTVASIEKELSDLRRSTSGVTEQLRAKDAEITALTKDRDNALAKVTQVETARTVRGLVKDEYPDLLDMFDADDLRPRTDFADDAAYKSYLGRTASRLGVKSASERAAEDEETEIVVGKVRGASPAAAATSRERQAPRTRQEIAVEMAKIADSDSPKYRALEEEMETALR